MSEERWQFWIDRGGTFTDIVGRCRDGRLEVRKLLSQNPRRYDDAATQGIRDILGIPARDPIPPGCVEAVKLGTTVATNALLERKGEPLVFVTTRGLGDVLRIGTQERPDLFALGITLPDMLYTAVVEAAGRLSAGGDEIEAPDLGQLGADLSVHFGNGIRTCAIALLHGYRYPAHEQAVARVARSIGYEHIVVSHEANPLMRLVGRGDTTCAEAYVSPLLGNYVRAVEANLSGAPLFLMQSNGGLAQAASFRGKDSLLSGPAGGVVGAAGAAVRAGVRQVVSFDMGGTSTDVAHFDGEYHRVGEARLAGVRVRTPMLEVHTVAAGGGSILWFDGDRLRVGPHSAGAEPGPACYRNGGPATVTDANMVLGRLQPGFLAPVFGESGNQPPDVEASRRRLSDLAVEVSCQSGREWTPEETAEAYLAIAVANMANAIRTVSVQRGYDVTEHALCSFGGAGGQHACALADELGMRHIVVHPLAGVLSAYGIGIADIRAVREKAVEAPLTPGLPATLLADLGGLKAATLAEVAGQAPVESNLEVLHTARIRQAGSDTCLSIPITDEPTMRSAFLQAHLRLFGFEPTTPDLMVESTALEAIARNVGAPTKLDEADGCGSPVKASVVFGGFPMETTTCSRASLEPRQSLVGPAIITDSTGTTVVSPGWQASIDAERTLHLTRTHAATPAGGPSRMILEPDPAWLEVFANLFRSIAEEMGATLRHTCRSVNIKERLDFSCAIFDAEGDLVANAPHIPVHLGSMGDAVKAVILARRGRFAPGQAFATNNPYAGGTHLPDITVVTPVFETGHETPSFFAASRGHHADVGGASPGSMPAGSRELQEEGVVLTHLPVLLDGRLRVDDLRAALEGGPCPARDPDTNIADLAAQVAANARGAQRLAALLDRYGGPTVAAYMGHVQRNAEACVRQAITSLAGTGVRRGVGSVEMDDGSVIRVRTALDGTTGSAVLDFEGTSPQHPGNLNAPGAVTRAAVLYVFRTLVSDDIPLNAGSLRPITIQTPRGSMLSPEFPAAVAAGNVETSQAIVDALFAALGVMAGCQGTMNNITFGNSRCQYYETLCGGAGAGPDFHGASAVHTHMTNTRLTDPEVLELRYPVRVEEFAIRKGSGGAGAMCGGNGVTRRLRFLEPVTVSVLSNHRRVPPSGGNGGGDGAPGINRLIRADGSVEDLAGTAVRELAAGDSLEVHTPGGGGWGRQRPKAPRVDSW